MTLTIGDWFEKQIVEGRITPGALQILGSYLKDLSQLYWRRKGERREAGHNDSESNKVWILKRNFLERGAMTLKWRGAMA